MKDTAFAADLWVREFMVPTADDPNLRLFVRNKFLGSSSSMPSAYSGVGNGNRTVLMIAGATYPTSTSLDMELSGLSWMDYLARSGYDVWLIDQRGYGRSDRPWQMSQPAANNSPICNTSVVAGDVDTVATWIRGQRSIPAMNLIGWSWGTSIMSLYASMNTAQVAKLVLYAPQWMRSGIVAPVGAYRTVTKAVTLSRWMNGVAAHGVTQSQLIPGDWFDAWWNATVVLDPVGAAENPPVIRAPNGIQEDNYLYWNNGIAVYNITALNMPVMITHGEYDIDLPIVQTEGVWFNLTNVPSKRWVEVAASTHMMCMEHNRMILFRSVQAFLDEPNPISLVPQPGAVDYRVYGAAAAAPAIAASAASADADMYQSRYHSAVAGAAIMAVIAIALAGALGVAFCKLRDAGAATAARSSARVGGRSPVVAQNPAYGKVADASTPTTV